VLLVALPQLGVLPLLARETAWTLIIDEGRRPSGRCEGVHDDLERRSRGRTAAERGAAVTGAEARGQYCVGRAVVVGELLARLNVSTRRHQPVALEPRVRIAPAQNNNN
jgi:hypothetical protein